MRLSSSQLEAFAEVARVGSFSLAAKNLFITQSALSQRVQNLENDLATALIIRDPSGLRLTSAGEDLLRFCQIQDSLEAEVVDKISATKSSMGGVIRVAGFSSVMRSMILPALHPLINKHPKIQLEIYTRELRDLHRMLANNETDIIITSQPSPRQDIISYDLGVEENVLVESANLPNARSEIYLDHDPEDTTTAEFFKLNGEAQKRLKRNYLDEVYAIVDGVKLGLGRAVLPRHLIENERKISIVKGYKPLKVKILLQHYRQPYYSKLQSSVIEELQSKLTIRR